MSAATLREPARTDVVASHYLRLLARERGVSTFFIPLSLMLLGSLNASGFAGLGLPLALAFFFPLYQWRGGGRDPLDAAMPVDSARHRRIRLASAAAWATLGLAVCVGVYTALFAMGTHGLDGYPAWYPVLLLGWGLAAYLFGAATWLRADRPGRAMTLAYFGISALLEFLPPRWTHMPLALAKPAEIRAVPAAGWAAACLLTLSLACAVSWAAASSRPGLPRLRAARPAGPRASETVDARTPAAPAAYVPGLRRPAGFFRILRCELEIVGHGARWALLIAMLTALQSLRLRVDVSVSTVVRIPLEGRAKILMVFSTVAFFWPILVWMDDRGAGRELAEAAPAGITQRRLLRLLAGGVWLELMALVVEAGVALGAWRAGVIASPLGLPATIGTGFPAGVLMMYLLGSIPLLRSQDHPVRRTVTWYVLFSLLIVPPVFMTWRWTFSPGAALSVIMLDPPRYWAGAVLVWLPVLATGIVAMVATGVARDRREGTRPRPAG
ncbi:MAG TPA: hypothetical protein VF092_30205 [Longimicrobium sp.]